MPRIMTSIISGHTRTSPAISNVLAGTPAQTSPTTRIATATAYRPHCGRFIGVPLFPDGRDTIRLRVPTTPGQGQGSRPLRVEGPYPSGVSPPTPGFVGLAAPRRSV